MIETIYAVPAGVLRPHDSIELLTGPVPSRAWWRNHFHDLHSADNAALGDELLRKLRAHGIEEQVGLVNTIDDLVKVWCGRAPRRTLSAIRPDE